MPREIQQALFETATKGVTRTLKSSARVLRDFHPGSCISVGHLPESKIGRARFRSRVLLTDGEASTIRGVKRFWKEHGVVSASDGGEGNHGGKSDQP